MRFTLTIPNEPPRRYVTRREPLAYVAGRINRRELPHGATLTDTKTGTVMQFKEPEMRN